MNLKSISFLISFLVSIICCQTRDTSSLNSYQNEIDSVTTWLEASRNSKLSKDQRIKNLKRAYLLTNRVRNDSLRIKLLLELTTEAIDLKDDTLFNHFNDHSLTLSNILRDTSSIAETH